MQAMEALGNSEQKLKEYLRVWDEIESSPEPDDQLRLLNVSSIAGELSTLMCDLGLFEKLSTFVENIAESLLQDIKENDKFLLSLVHLHIWKKRYKNARCTILENNFTDCQRARILWFQSLYAEKERVIRSPLSPVMRFRIRQRNPPPSHICTEDYKAKSGLPVKSKLLLKGWLDQHQAFPYPSNTETALLAEQCDITKVQVKTWFSNARRRIRDKKKNTYKRKRNEALILNKDANGLQDILTEDAPSPFMPPSSNAHQVGLPTPSCLENQQEQVVPRSSRQEVLTPQSETLILPLPKDSEMKNKVIDDSSHQRDCTDVPDSNCHREPAVFQDDISLGGDNVMYEEIYKEGHVVLKDSGKLGEGKVQFFTAESEQEVPSPTYLSRLEKRGSFSLPIVLVDNNTMSKREGAESEGQLQQEIMDLSEALIQDISTGQITSVSHSNDLSTQKRLHFFSQPSAYSADIMIPFATSPFSFSGRHSPVSDLSVTDADVPASELPGVFSVPGTQNMSDPICDQPVNVLNHGTSLFHPNTAQIVSPVLTNCTITLCKSQECATPPVYPSLARNNTDDPHFILQIIDTSGSYPTSMIDILNACGEKQVTLAPHQVYLTPTTTAYIPQPLPRQGVKESVTLSSKSHTVRTDQNNGHMFHMVPDLTASITSEKPSYKHNADKYQATRTKLIPKTRLVKNKRKKKGKRLRKSSAKQLQGKPMPLLPRDPEQQEIAQVLLDLAMNYNSPNSQGSYC